MVSTKPLCDSYFSINFYDKNSLDKLLLGYEQLSTDDITAIKNSLNSQIDNSYEFLHNDTNLLNLLAFYNHTTYEKYKNCYFPLEPPTKENIENQDIEDPSYILEKYIRLKCLSFNKESWFISFDYHFSHIITQKLSNQLYESLINKYNLNKLYRKYMIDYDHIITKEELKNIKRELALCKHLSIYDKSLLDIIDKSIESNNIIVFAKFD